MTTENQTDIDQPILSGTLTPVYAAERTGEDVPEMLTWWVAISPIEPPDTTEGGIAIPESARDAASHLAAMGFIVSIGPQAWAAKTRGGLDLSMQRTDVKLMDFVLFPAYAGHRLRMKDGTRLVILKDIEVLAKHDPSFYQNMI